MPILSKRKKLLACVLTEDELVQKRKELVSETRSRELRESALQSFKDRCKSEQKVYEADVLHAANQCFKLAGIIDSGIEHREVECIEELEDKGTAVNIVRTDTGEVIERRVATKEELQRTIDFTCTCDRTTPDVHDPACPVHGVPRNEDGTAADAPDDEEDDEPETTEDPGDPDRAHDAEANGDNDDDKVGEA